MITRRIQYEMAGRVVGPMLMSLERWQKSRRRRGGKKKDTPFGPSLESVRRLKELMTVYYFKGRYADGAVPVAWVTSGFPVELLRPLGFYVVYPENHAAICSVQRLVPELSDAAEAEGYSRDLCGYARCDLGSVITKKTPMGRLPKPDMLACCTNICQTVLYWYRSLAAHFQVPLVLIDTPFVFGEAAPHHIQYVKDQLEELMEAAEKIGGKKVATEELEETTRMAVEGTRLWGECLAAGRNEPSPWTAFDGFFHMAPIVTMRGGEECNSYYRGLLDELKDRIQRGIGGIKNEKYRLLWDNLPIWFNVRELSTLFAENHFNFVCSTYTDAWTEAGSRIDPADPIGSAAEAYTYIILNRDLKNRLDLIERLTKEYKVHGAVLHSDRSCKPYSIGQIDLKERLGEGVGIKALVLEADHADPRSYAREPAENRLLAFMESFH